MFYRARLFQTFFKLTAYPLQLPIFRNKIYYEDRRVQGRYIHGKAIIASNHISVFDYIALIFVFPLRVTRAVIAEVLYSKNIFLTLFLNLMGGMKVVRDVHDLTFEEKAFKVLDKGGVVVMYPEGRTTDNDKNVPVREFKTTFVYMALKSKTPIIPYYSNGEVFSSARCKIIVGKPIDVWSLYDYSLSEKENRRKISDYLRNKIMFLKEELERQDGTR